jgi:PEP-CTERM motif
VEYDLILQRVHVGGHCQSGVKQADKFLRVSNLALGIVRISMSALNDANTRQSPEITDFAAALTEPKVFRVSGSFDLRTLSMKLRSLILTLTFLVPSVASAAPITLGVWSPLPAADGDLDPYWDGLSFDCPTCGAGYLLYGEYPGLEYLNNGAGGFTPFAFEEPITDWTLEYSITAWTNGVLGQRADGAFTYNSGTGRLSNSIDSPGQYALFRHVTPEWTEYYLAIEDILLDEPVNDRDYNDYVVSFTVPTQTVPEPSTLLLFALPVLGLVGRSVRGRRVTEARG